MENDLDDLSLYFLFHDCPAPNLDDLFSSSTNIQENYPEVAQEQDDAAQEDHQHEVHNRENEQQHGAVLEQDDDVFGLLDIPEQEVQENVEDLEADYAQPNSDNAMREHAVQSRQSTVEANGEGLIQPDDQDHNAMENDPDDLSLYFLLDDCPAPNLDDLFPPSTEIQENYRQVSREDHQHEVHNHENEQQHGAVLEQDDDVFGLLDIPEQEVQENVEDLQADYAQPNLDNAMIRENAVRSRQESTVDGLGEEISQPEEDHNAIFPTALGGFIDVEDLFVDNSNDDLEDLGIVNQPQSDATLLENPGDVGDIPQLDQEMI
ncbi:hypothetical protein ACH5RR_041276 [Cinchona calisaya]|uniref:Uncharacterized protein n=1 Tax=Cinchona calisaya TaxID=153742 RepID=A0ABD2XX41_9GENT